MDVIVGRRRRTSVRYGKTSTLFRRALCTIVYSIAAVRPHIQAAEEQIALPSKLFLMSVAKRWANMRSDVGNVNMTPHLHEQRSQGVHDVAQDCAVAIRRHAQDETIGPLDLDDRGIGRVTTNRVYNEPHRNKRTCRGGPSGRSCRTRQRPRLASRSRLATVGLAALWPEPRFHKKYEFAETPACSQKVGDAHPAGRLTPDQVPPEPLALKPCRLPHR